MKEQWNTPTIETLDIRLTENELGMGDSSDEWIAGLIQAKVDAGKPVGWLLKLLDLITVSGSETRVSD